MSNEELLTAFQQILDKSLGEAEQRLNAKIDVLRTELRTEMARLDDGICTIYAAVKDGNRDVKDFKIEVRTAFQKLDKRLNRTDLKIAETITRMDDLDDRVRELESQPQS